MGDVGVYDVATGRPMYSSVSGQPSLTCMMDCKTTGGDCNASSYDVTWTDKDGNTVTQNFLWNSPDFLWNSGGAAHRNISCVSLGGTPATGPHNVLETTDNATNTDIYFWYSNAGTCPSENIADWTLWSDPPSHNIGTLVSIVRNV